MDKEFLRIQTAAAEIIKELVITNETTMEECVRLKESNSNLNKKVTREQARVVEVETHVRELKASILKEREKIQLMFEIDTC